MQQQQPWNIDGRKPLPQWLLQQVTPDSKTQLQSLDARIETLVVKRQQLRAELKHQTYLLHLSHEYENPSTPTKPPLPKEANIEYVAALLILACDLPTITLDLTLQRGDIDLPVGQILHKLKTNARTNRTNKLKNDICALHPHFQHFFQAPNSHRSKKRRTPDLVHHQAFHTTQPTKKQRRDILQQVLNEQKEEDEPPAAKQEEEEKPQQPPLTSTHPRHAESSDSSSSSSSDDSDN